jgi:hypothetical protein
MIQNKSIAKEISQLMLEYSAKLDSSVAQVKAECSEEELNLYRKAVGKIMGYMLLDIMNPLYDKHPDLKPKELD